MGSCTLACRFLVVFFGFGRACVYEVVGIIVVADWTGLCLVELCVLDFFELHHGLTVTAIEFCGSERVK